jgi:hypothetical protein
VEERGGRVGVRGRERREGVRGRERREGWSVWKREEGGWECVDERGGGEKIEVILLSFLALFIIRRCYQTCGIYMHMCVWM